MTKEDNKTKNKRR